MYADTVLSLFPMPVRQPLGYLFVKKLGGRMDRSVCDSLDASLAVIRIVAAAGVIFALSSLKVSLALAFSGGAVLSMPVTQIVAGVLLGKAGIVALQAAWAMGNLALFAQGALLGYVGYYLIDGCYFSRLGCAITQNSLLDREVFVPLAVRISRTET
ncbi:MAG TPA: hypothetical protein VGM34_02540 [Chlamydiales bacterium]|jgi:hypothetical protein